MILINDLAWAIFSYKINVLKSLFHFIVAKVKPVVSWQWCDLVSPSCFLENTYKVHCNGILLHSSMSNTSGIIGESEYTMLMSSFDRNVGSQYTGLHWSLVVPWHPEQVSELVSRFGGFPLPAPWTSFPIQSSHRKVSSWRFFLNTTQVANFLHRECLLFSM